MKFFCKSAVTSLLILGSLLTGCSDSERPPTYPVTGIVTLHGKPLPGAAITFVPSGDGEAASAMTDSEGKYALTTWEQGDGARSGQYKIKISKTDAAAVEPSKMVQNLSLEEEQKIYVENAKPTPAPKKLIPAKYENEETSGLTHTVNQEATTFDITIP